MAETTVEGEAQRYNLGKWNQERSERERDRQRDAARASFEHYEPPEYGVVTLEELRIDDRYQRTRTEAKVHLLRAMFYPNACQPLAVSKRADGRLYCVDGQHRRAVLQDIGIREWPALIYSNLSRRDEAAMWEELNTRQTKPHPNARFKAAIERRDPEALAIRDVVTGAGLRINFKRGRCKASGLEIDAIEAIVRIYRQANAPGLADTLALVQEAWPDPDEVQRTARIILLGVAAFLTTSWAHPVERKFAATVIGRYTPSVWITKTRGATSGESPADILCGRIRAAYNKAKPRGDRL